MPKISELQRESRRQQILQAALRCFSRDGFHATTTAEIVRESGVSQGALYLYFATKDDIVVALADDRAHGQAFLNALAESEPDPVEGLFLLVELYGRSLAEPSRTDVRRVSVQGWGEALRNPRIQASVIEGLRPVREAIAHLVERGKASGQIRADVDGDSLARILIAVSHGLIAQISWDEPVDLAKIGALLRGMILGALVVHQSPASEGASS